MRVKIAFIAPLTNNENQGGITSIARYLQSNISSIEKDHNLTITFLDSCEIDKPMSQRGKISLVNIKNAYLLLRAILLTHKKGVDLFHFNTSCGIALFKDLIIMKCAKILNRSPKFIIHIHFAELEKVLPKNRFLSKLSLKLLKSESYQIITLGEKLKSELSLEGINSKKIHCVYNFHDYDRFTFTKNSNSEISLLFIGSLDERKGLLDIITALQKINQSKYELIVCGTFQNDDYKKKVLKKIKSIGIEDKVHFKGFIQNDVKSDVYNNADILILPSYGEGLPLVLLEAMATNNSIIISDVGSISEIFSDSENGFLINPGDIETLSKKILFLSSNPKVLEEQKRNNLKLSKNFTGEKFVANLKKIYSS